ncbi:MAG: hypothetical protein RR495_04200 [Anaerovoracaceae bacterium]
MRQKHKRKMLAVLLTMVLLISGIPMTAFAAPPSGYGDGCSVEAEH